MNSAIDLSEWFKCGKLWGKRRMGRTCFGITAVLVDV